MNQDFILELYYSLNGDLDQINAVIDAKLNRGGSRKITTFELFIKSRISRNVKTLKMASMDINPDEAAYLSLYPDLSELTVLDLRKNFLGDTGLQAIAISPVLKNLKEMDLRNNQITRVGLEFLSKNTTLTQLEKLDLRSNKLGKRWEEKLKESDRLPHLREVKTL
jgi:Ran GTPase-activating protein (RanGAP) involved in mRNA processing and transport